MRQSLPFAALAVLTLALAACGGAPQTVVPGAPTAATETLAPLLTPENAIPGQYIVVFKKGVNLVSDGLRAQSAGELVRALNLDASGVQVQNVYATALKGFSAALSETNVAKLRADARVAYIEQDAIVKPSATQSPATWGLDRIDQANLPLSNSYTYNATGSGVTAYVVDTGINYAHTDFGGRASFGYDAIGDGRNGNDCQGHGTHVAGTIGSATWGVAKTVNLVAVRVLGCDGSGSNSGVIAGVNWVAQNARKPAVANMSLGGGASSALDSAVAGAVNAGVTFVVAAGNENQNACNVSPARAASAITVGSTTNTDARSSFSNFGSCVDVFAPGSNITSTWIGSNSATNTISGTSMASPHVAGVAALYLQGSPSASPATVTSAIVNGAVTSKVTNAGTGSPNRLLQTSFGGATPPPNPTPGETYTGSLSGTGASAIQPNGSYFQYAGGTLRGNLTGPSNADFDLFLQRWSGSAWTTVARSESATSTESITYNASSAYYRWRVLSYSGSGSYTLTVQR